MRGIVVSRSLFNLLKTCPHLHNARRLPMSSLAANIAEKSPYSTDVTTKWQIVGAVCLTRLPIVTPPMTPLEAEYSELLQKYEKNFSLKNEHELRCEQDMIRAALLKSGDTEEADLEESSFQTGFEFEDACIEELKAVNFEPILRDADKTGNMKTLDQALDRALVLLVKQKLGDDIQWIFPQSPWIPGETLRQTCERIVQEKCGSELNVKFLGNAPCGFYKYKYPKNLRSEKYIGAKVFFYKGLITGVDKEVKPGKDIVDYQWLTHNQLDEKLKPSYAKSVAKFLVSDQ